VTLLAGGESVLDGVFVSGVCRLLGLHPLYLKLEKPEAGNQPHHSSAVCCAFLARECCLLQSALACRCVGHRARLRVRVAPTLARRRASRARMSRATARRPTTRSWSCRCGAALHPPAPAPPAPTRSSPLGRRCEHADLLSSPDLLRCLPTVRLVCACQRRPNLAPPPLLRDVWAAAGRPLQLGVPACCCMFSWPCCPVRSTRTYAGHGGVGSMRFLEVPVRLHVGLIGVYLI